MIESKSDAVTEIDALTESTTVLKSTTVTVSTANAELNALTGSSKIDDCCFDEEDEDGNRRDARCREEGCMGLFTRGSGSDEDQYRDKTDPYEEARQHLSALAEVRASETATESTALTA